MMKKKLSAVLSASLTIALLAGCGGSGTNENAGSGAAEIEKTTPDSYPIQTDKTLTYWCDLSGHVSTHAKSLNETPFAENLAKKTGIKVEFIHPAAGGSGQANEQFNLMIASGELPDIIESDWANYPGGPERAMDENIILDLTKVFEKVSPNITKFYEEHPDYKKQVETVSGKLYHYPFILGDDKLMTYIGPMIRQDLLDRAGMEMPETIDEWDAVLRKFKSMGIETPLVMRIDNKNLQNVSPFMACYKIAGGFYVDNGKVKYGPYEPAFKDYVMQLAAWYKDGIFDNNFMDTDSKRITALVASGNVGAAFGSGGGDFGKWIPALKQLVPEADFEPLKYPTAEKGTTPMYGQKNLPLGTFGAAISGTSENVELAARLLDYGYSEEGHMFYNFGVEGESYEMKDGIPCYTDIVTDEKKNGGLAIGGGIGKYARASYNGPFVQDVHYLDQFYSLDEQKAAVGLWSDTDTLEHKIPSGLLTDEENNEYTTIIQDIDTFREAEFYKLITGKSTDFDGYFSQLKDRGIERAIEIQQQAYDRYKAR
ncbi:MAG: extracellular solute-binding protein [Clostridia bacterium]|nr:extracellular solute-binding protein [Clostridia bacterium]